MLEAGRPDPFSTHAPYTTIRFHLPETAHTTLRIFNAAGRRVRGLVDAELEPGQHVATWDGRNDGGQESGAGVYFYRLEADGRSTARSLIRIK
jgi:flagellar hook assembly protein FlgD